MNTLKTGPESEITVEVSGYSFNLEEVFSGIPGVTVTRKPKKMPCIVTLGAPGSGKTMSWFPTLKEHFGLPYVGTGDFLKALWAHGGDSGRTTLYEWIGSGLYAKALREYEEVKSTHKEVGGLIISFIELVRGVVHDFPTLSALAVAKAHGYEHILTDSINLQELGYLVNTFDVRAVVLLECAHPSPAQAVNNRTPVTHADVRSVTDCPILICNYDTPQGAIKAALDVGPDLVNLLATDSLVTSIAEITERHTNNPNFSIEDK